MEEKLKLVQAKDLTPGTKIWITVTDPKQKTETKFVPAEVIKVLGTKDQVHVKFEDGSRNSMDAEDFNTFNISTISLRSEKVVPVEDLVLMKYINDPEIGATLKSRFNSDEVYTYCGSTMVSINPYCLFQGEYSVKKKLEYKEHLKNSFFIMQKIPPHIYSMALSSVHEIIYDDTPASKLSICLGGESGSGKTEAALYCLDFIVFCYKENPEPGSIESRVRKLD
jgi:myosin-5